MAMTRPFRWNRAVLLAMLAALAGCGEPPRLETKTPPVDLVWPSPPMTPRIRFVATLKTAADAGIRRSWLNNVWAFVKGAPERRMSRPFAITMDTEGRLYVVDTFHKAVQVFDVKNAEQYWFPRDEIENFSNPVGIAAGPEGRLYVSDSVANVVHVFEDGGRRYVRAVGRGALRRPTGIAVDGTTGDILVADTLSSQIVVIDAGSLEVKKFIGREGTEPDAFHSPTNIAVAENGTVYVSDSLNNRVQVLGRNFEFQMSFGQPGDSPGDFSRPKGVAVDSEGHVYVVDALFDNVQVFDRQGRLLLAFGSPGSEPGRFWLPNDIYIDRDDRIYVTDSFNQRIQVFQYLKEGGKR